MPHELRRGELAWSGLIPHTPYYGAHDVPALYCLALWNAWRWTGNERLLDEHLATARRALAWCDEFGDRDRDGLQEYGTRSKAGYYNQGWKERARRMCTPTGRWPSCQSRPLSCRGTSMSRLAMAELLETRGEASDASRQRELATALRETVERRFWMEDAQTYALALDVASDPSPASPPIRATCCGAACLRVSMRRRWQPGCSNADMFSGWGLRTLSADHPTYNPLSYQNGSVWPHQHPDRRRRTGALRPSRGRSAANARHVRGGRAVR